MKKNNLADVDIERIAAGILSGMSLKEKSLIANIGEKSLPYLQYAFEVYISRNVGDDPETGAEIMKQIWRTLQRTHRLRLVKEG